MQPPEVSESPPAEEPPPEDASPPVSGQDTEPEPMATILQSSADEPDISAPDSEPNTSDTPAPVNAESEDAPDRDLHTRPQPPPETAPPESDGQAHPLRRRRSRHRRQSSQKARRRRTLVQLGVLTLTCILIAGAMFIIQKRSPSVDRREMNAKLEESLNKQLIKEIMRNQALEEAIKTK